MLRVTHPTYNLSPLPPPHTFICAFFFGSNSCHFKLARRQKTLHVCLELFSTIFPERVFSQLVLGNWKQNGETPSTRINHSLTNLFIYTHIVVWRGERSTSDGQCRREFPETFSWCDVCQQNWPYMDWRMYVNTETILRWDVSNVKQLPLL